MELSTGMVIGWIILGLVIGAYIGFILGISFVDTWWPKEDEEILPRVKRT